VIVHVGAVKIKNDGNAVLGIVPMIGAVVDALRIIGVVVIIIELKFLILGVGVLAEFVQLRTNTV